MGKKTIQVKVKKKKIRVKRIICLLIFLLLVYFGLSYFLNAPIKNIYVIGNDIINDSIIIRDAKIDNYPSFFLTTKNEIRNNLLKNDYIKDVEVKKKFFNKVYLYVSENRPICSVLNEDNLILLDGSKVSNIYEDFDVPVLVNDVSSIYDDFVKYFSKIDYVVLKQISEISYSPVNVDKERFSLTMNDGNLVYITLTKIEKLNKYISINQELEGKKGIIYLDSGDYFEIKDDPNKKNEDNETSNNEDEDNLDDDLNNSDSDQNNNLE